MHKSQLSGISESAWQHEVLTIAMDNGWLCHCVPDDLYRRSFAVSKHGANQGDKGWPDLVMVRETDDGRVRCIIAELKSEAGSVRKEQRVWLEAMAKVQGIEVYVWKPRHRSEVDQVLAREAVAA